MDAGTGRVLVHHQCGNLLRFAGSLRPLGYIPDAHRGQGIPLCDPGPRPDLGVVAGPGRFPPLAFIATDRFHAMGSKGFRGSPADSRRCICLLEYSQTDEEFPGDRPDLFGRWNHSSGTRLVSRSRVLASRSAGGWHSFDADSHQLSLADRRLLTLDQAQVSDIALSVSLPTKSRPPTPWSRKLFCGTLAPHL